MYKISIIIPVFNIGEKLKDAFESIKNQTFDFENLEIIFVDDCSTDNSADIIKEYSDCYENVKSIIMDENSGYAGKPRNIGIENATADYLMFLDPDDVYLENACETLYENIVGTDLDMVSGNFLSTSINGEYKISWYNIELTDGSIQIDSIYKQPKLFLLPPSVWSKIFKKDFILDNNITFPVGIPAQDVVFVYNSLLKANNIKYVDIPVVRYIPGVDESKNQSVTSTRNKNTIFGLLKAYYYALDLFDDYEDLMSYVAIHLNFWVKQVVISGISHKEKSDFFRYAYPIFKIFKNSDNLYIRKGLEEIFHKVYQKDFIGAADLSEYAAVQLNENYYNVYAEIKTRDIFIIFDDYEYLSENGDSIVDFLASEGYGVKFLDVGSIDAFEEFADSNPDKFVIHNIYDYYSREFNLNNENGCVKKEEGNYFTPDGFKFLEVSQDIKLMNRFDKLYITFESMDDFYSYFIETLCSSSDKKPFLVNFADFEFENVNPLSAFKVDGENIDLLNAEEVNSTFRDAYIQEVLSVDGVQVENESLKNQVNKLKSELKSSKQSNKKLKKDLKNSKKKLKEEKKSEKKLKDELKKSKQSYDEIISSSSWKVTKPFRKVTNTVRKVKK